MKVTSDHILVPVQLRDLGEPIGRGVFLRDPVARGTILAIFGGHATPGHQFRQLPAERQQHGLQVADDVFLVPGDEPSLGNYVNHSCDPTAVLVGEITLAAVRELRAGEQITFDYATSDSSPYDEFECGCGAARCRTKVTGEDWMSPDVQRMYDGHFSPYLQRKIDSFLGDPPQ